MPCGPKRWRPGGASPVTSRATSKETTGSMRKKMGTASAAKGASPKQNGSREGEDKTPSARPKCVPNKSSKVKRAPYLNPDAFCRFIGPKNSCLLSLGQWSSTQFHYSCLCSGMGNGHYVLELFGARDRGIHPTHQRPRRHLSGAHWVHYDERQSARCPRV